MRILQSVQAEVWGCVRISVANLSIRLVEAAVRSLALPPATCRMAGARAKRPASLVMIAPGTSCHTVGGARLSNDLMALPEGSSIRRNRAALRLKTP